MRDVKRDLLLGLAMRTVEILLYTLKPGTGAEFDRIMRETSVPLQNAVAIDVVRFGNSAHEADRYYLIRAFDSLAHLEQSQASFYASDAWRSGPRQSIIDRIETSMKSVIELDAVAVEALRLKRG